ncbi:hypothetical protein B0H13DRAFT_2340348 [Mycena leptocephala]|nr:hypothetical protein B0H13DRAFT_2340348 [Mycena leptocephala]
MRLRSHRIPGSCVPAPLFIILRRATHFALRLHLLSAPLACIPLPTRPLAVSARSLAISARPPLAVSLPHAPARRLSALLACIPSTMHLLTTHCFPSPARPLSAPLACIPSPVCLLAAPLAVSLALPHRLRSRSLFCLALPPLPRLTSTSPHSASPRRRSRARRQT